MKAALLLATAFSVVLSAAASAAEPDYTVWNQLLARYYDPARGMDYRALKAKDVRTLTKLRADLGRVNVGALGPKEQLAFWINFYNVSVVGIVVDHYPVDSIRDISTDPLIRLNVFSKDHVTFGGRKMSLNDIENEKIREGFKDARIHFAINCAARSCPPIREAAFTGARLDQQLDEQSRRFINGPNGIRLGKKGDTLVIHTTKIMDWFGEDFSRWGGGVVPFIRRYATPARAKAIAAAKDVDVEFDEYDWALNDWKR